MSFFIYFQDTRCSITLTFHAGIVGGNFPCGSGVKPANGKKERNIIREMDRKKRKNVGDHFTMKE